MHSVRNWTEIDLWLRYWQYGCDDFYRGTDKSLARPRRKQATATEDFEFHISYS